MCLHLLTTLIIFAMMSSIGAKSATLPDQDLAFYAAYGHSAPIFTQVKRPLFVIDDHKLPRQSGFQPLTMRLDPDQLVQLDKFRWALVVRETAQGVGYSIQGAISVAYLRYIQHHWSVEHLWPEVFYSGLMGHPANDDEQVFRFGSVPLYLATTEWCGMGTCSDWIDVMSLSPTKPLYLGQVLGGARYPDQAEDLNLYNKTCENHVYTAQIGPPVAAGSIFTIFYKGWRSPPQKLEPKTVFRFVTDAIPKGDKLEMHPEVTIPNCGR